MKKLVLISLLLVSVHTFANPQTTIPTKHYQYETPVGLQYNIIKQGNGKKPTLKDEVEIRFISYDSQGETLDGTLNNVPIILPIETAFSGLQQSLLLMSEGSIYDIFIPAQLGYQEEGKKSRQAITYHIELLRINP